MPPKKARPRLERRGHARADASLSMRVEGRPAEGDLTQIVTESHNISVSGVYCSSPRYLAPLSKVALTIVLPNQRNTQGAQRLLKCDGVVVRCLPRGSGPKGFELACSFIGLEPRHRALLDDFVTWRNLNALTQEPGMNGKVQGASRKAPRRTGTRRSARAKGDGKTTARKSATKATSGTSRQSSGRRTSGR